MKNSFYIQKDKITNDKVIIEFNKIDGYKVIPKAKKNDEIEVSKIIFVSKKLSEKIIKKKIELKIKHLLKILEEIDTTSDSAPIERSIIEAEKLRLTIINIYAKYLGNTYQSLTLKKIQIIIEQLRVKLYVSKEKTNIIEYQNLIKEKVEKEKQTQIEIEEPKKGRGR